MMDTNQFIDACHRAMEYRSVIRANLVNGWYVDFDEFGIYDVTMTDDKFLHLYRGGALVACGYLKEVGSVE
ncbi:MAG: hypothetical protein QXU18_04615 [Thermoplasmatales archaeon]